MADDLVEDFVSQIQNVRCRHFSVKLEDYGRGRDVTATSGFVEEGMLMNQLVEPHSHNNLSRCIVFSYVLQFTNALHIIFMNAQ